MTITASAGTHGSISPAGAVAILCDADQAFTITPDPCYHVADVLVDGSSVGPATGYVLTHVTANRTISATFAIDTYIDHGERRIERRDLAVRRERA